MIYLLILIIILVFCIYFLKKDIKNLTNKWSTLASKNYKVREKLPNSDDTPNIIAKLELFIDEFINYLDGNNPHDKRVKRLKDRFRGYWNAWKKRQWFDSIYDHAMPKYVKRVHDFPFYTNDMKR